MFLFFLAGKAFGQYQIEKPVPHIAAKDAYQYIGMRVLVVDSIYSGTIVADSLAVCQMGPKTNTPRLTAIIVCPPKYRPLDQRFFKTFQHSKIALLGTITGTKEAPVITAHSDTREFRHMEYEKDVNTSHEISIIAYYSYCG